MHRHHGPARPVRKNREGEVVGGESFAPHVTKKAVAKKANKAIVAKKAKNATSIVLCNVSEDLKFVQRRGAAPASVDYVRRVTTRYTSGARPLSVGLYTYGLSGTVVVASSLTLVQWSFDVGMMSPKPMTPPRSFGTG